MKVAAAIECEIRRAGDGSYYLVKMDEFGHSTEMYDSKGELLKFDSSQDARDHLYETEVGAKRRRRIVE
jgi:hypothetical protein